MGAERCAHLCALHLAYAVARKSPAECLRWQAFVLLAGDGLDAEDPAARGDLVRMGCLRDNAEHDPRLYKSHVLWRERKIAEIESFFNSLWPGPARAL